jgi:hypothetical protein
MNITIRKDAVLIAMNAVEFADVGATNGMINRIYNRLCADLVEAQKLGKVRYETRDPFVFYSQPSGDLHILRILCHAWEYFKDMDPTSVWEKEIQVTMTRLGVSGDAERLTKEYSQ